MNQSINTDSKNSKEQQQKYRLGTVSIKILRGLNRFYGHNINPHLVFFTRKKGLNILLLYLRILDVQRLLDFPIRQTFDATLVAYCGHIEELCHYAGGRGRLDGTHVYFCLKWTHRTIITPNFGVKHITVSLS